MNSGKSSAAPPALNQLPAGAQVSAGQVVIQNNGNTTTVQQGSAKASVNWNSFDVGANATVNFVQPDSSAVILNRVNGTNPSQIYGQVNANGQVYLVNPAGVYFAPGASVNVGGIVATTHQLSDADFLAGKTSFSRQGASGTVINEGTLQARLGGYIALLAPEVRNSGVLIATQGTVAMAAGESVTLNFGSNAKLESITVTASQIKSLVENRLAVQAPEGLIILSARAGKDLIGSVVNSGTLEANGLTQSGGRIILDASSSLAHSGLASVNAAADSGASGGSVVAIADLSNPNGQALISGAIQARGGAKGGDGGFVETSAANIQIAATTKVDTRATSGRAGTWLIDPSDFTIAAGNTGTITGGTPTANVSGATLSNALSSGNVTILSSQGTAAGQGDINVNDTVSWSANQLTLTAARNININAVMTVSGGSTLVMQTGHADGVDAAVPGGTVNVGLSGDGSFKGRVDFAGRSGAGILTINGVGFSVINSLGVAGDATGSGSPATTLQGMAAAGNVSGNYVLGGNIDASGTSTWNMSSGATPVAAGFTPIGTSAAAFSGVFDGLGHTITGLRINLPSTASVGLFGATGGASTVRNVGLVGGSVSGASSVGSLSGANVGTVSNAYATATVSGTTTVGGLLGSNTGGAVSNAYASGNVSGTSTVGGLMGSSAGGSVASSYAGGAVSGTTSVGGLMGSNTSVVTNSYATGNVTGGSIVGGLMGSSTTGAVTTTYATGNVVATGTDVGGLMGTNVSVVSGAYATGTVAGTSGVGGLIGTSSAAVSSAYATGNVTGTSGIGGLIGTSSAAVTLSFATGNVTGTTGAGGLIGTSSETVSLSYAIGNVNGTTGSGGLIGTSSKAVSNAYATGSVTGTTGVGGLVGTSSAAVDQSLATGAVVGTAGSLAQGALVGTSSAAVSNSYWNTQTSLQTNSIGTGTQQGVGLTSAQMTQQTSFPGLVFGAPGSDPLTNPWTMSPGASSPMSRALTGSITVTANNKLQQYSSMAYAGGNGAVITGATSATVLSATTYTGTSQGAVNVGRYAITPFLTSSNPQFVVVYVNGTLTLSAAPLAIIVNNSTKVFGAVNPVFSGVVTGFVGGDTLANSTSGVVTYASVATPASNVGNYAITARGLTANNGNYLISDTDGTLVTTRAALNITANNATKVFGQTVAFNGSEFSSTGLQNGNSVGSVSLASVGAAATANVLGSPYAIVASGATGGTFTASNYFITYTNGTLATMQAALNITANNATKVFGQTVAFTGSEFSSAGLQNGNSVGSVSLTSVGAPSAATVLGSPYPIIASAATGGTFRVSNYVVTYTNGTMVVTAAPIPVPPVVNPTSGGVAINGGSPTDSSGSGGVVPPAPIPVPPVVNPTGGGGAIEVGSPPDQSGSSGVVPPAPPTPPSPIVTAQATNTNPAAKFLARCSTVIDPSVTKAIPDCWGSP
jgi:filamentous hemagglutinin family protein